MFDVTEKTINVDVKKFMSVPPIQLGDVDSVLKDADSLLAQSSRVPVATSEWNRETFAAVGDLRKIIKGRIKAAEDLRTSWTGPINAGLKAINEFFKLRTQPLANADGHLDSLMKKWSREEEARARDEQERIRRAAEEQALREAQRIEEEARKAREAEEAAAAAGNMKAAEQAATVAREAEARRDEVIEQAAVIPVADTAVRGARGLYGSTSGVRKVWKANVVSLRELSDEAARLVLDNEEARDAIRKALKPLLEPRLAALRESGKCDDLPGVEFYQDSSINIR